MKLDELLGEDKKKKNKQAEKGKIFVENNRPPDAIISRKSGGGILSESSNIERPTNKILHYSLAYINHDIFRGDNGRVLGYDNSHGSSHKHLMGKVIPEPNVATTADWDALRARFTAEWLALANKYLKGDKMTEENAQMFTQVDPEELERILVEFRKRGEFVRAALNGDPSPKSPYTHILTVEEWRAGKGRSPDNWCSMHPPKP